MVVSIVVMNLKIIAPLMVFVDRKLFQGFHKKMEWLSMYNNGVCKEHEVACQATLRHVGRGCYYYCIFD